MAAIGVDVWCNIVMSSSDAAPLQPAPLDAVDQKILTELIADSRLSNAALAQRVGVAPSTALLRTRQLQERGVIEGFTTRLSLSTIGRTVQALIAVKLRVHDREQIDAFTTKIPQLSGVLSMFHVSGVTDYLIHVAVASTDDLRDWVLNNLATDDAVAHTETTLVFVQHMGQSSPLE